MRHLGPLFEPQFAPGSADGGATGPFSFDRRVIQLKRRLVREATQAIGMLEAALDALWRLDRDAAKQVTRDDDTIDREEVAIEQECFNILALHHAFARDFRVLTFILKANADIERVADHAASIAKLYATESAVTATRIATQVFGGYGFMEEYPVARFYRDAKILEIGEGTSEVQRMLIARGLGLPVE